MTNQKYIEEIIKVAKQGDYKDYYETSGSSSKKYHSDMLLDPNFFRAIGKVKWNDEKKWRMIGGVAHKIDMETGKYIPVWIYYALFFYEINLTQDLDHAIEWLYKLIKE